jgi:hypothetical protein
MAVGAVDFMVVGAGIVSATRPAQASKARNSCCLGARLRTNFGKGQLRKEQCHATENSYSG